MYTADPKSNPNARFIHTVVEIDEKLEQMAGGSSSDFGTEEWRQKSMRQKSGDESRGRLVIANGDNIYAINVSCRGKKVETLFLSREHGKELENELAPERAQFRRQVKRQKKMEENVDGKLYGNTW